ncbi:S-layer homology domain-containing protein [Dethiosulfatibacter aminovorans DSM 17477]|uniref:S-layer homology domain-containing protein n=1 Tax=Dethiosulfatibacter aminovorans DSM 17477 TaxID=1121476 RepID=A0A1M6KPI6_9FIRM|nr:S-layer homology domain-containing protein [Dethiosulfatibacter aminovorans]SHJ60857.1 S-layer homology domain-containing protein [Dethiosulfatibacter aminovorans DSM 17477]
MKKILSLVLVIALVLGSFSFAFAATPSDVVDTDYEEAVETLIALGVVNGYPDGTYKPAKVVTRAEMAKLLMVELGYADLAGGTANFSDTAGHWAEGYIALAAGLNIVNGYPDGTFKADNTVTFDEALTMVVRGAGYSDESLTGTWPTNYKIKAINLDLLDDVAMKAAGADRGAVAQILYNALDLVYGEVNNDGDFEKNVDDKKIIDKIGEKVNDYEMTYDDIYDADDALDTVIDLTPYLYHTVDYYENADGDVAYVSDIETNEFVGDLDNVNDVDDEITVEDADDEEETFDVSSSTPLFYNGEKAEDIDVLDLMDDGSCMVKVIYDDDDVVQGVVAWEFEIVQIATEYSSRRPAVLNGLGTESILLPADLDDDDDVVLDADNLTIVGDADELKDIEKDDLVYVYASDKKAGTDEDLEDHPAVLKLEVVRDVVEGVELQEVEDEDEAVFDGDDYDASDFGDVDFDTFELGLEYDLTLDKDGDVYAMEEADDEETVEGYAVYVSEADGDVDEDDFTGDLSVDTEPRVKVFTDGGDVVIYDIDTDDLADDSDDFTKDATVTMGSISLFFDESEGEIIVNGLDKRDLVEIELNSDGEITDVTLVGIAYGGTDFDEDDMLLDDIDVIDNTLVFDIQESDEDDWAIVDADELVDGIEGEYDYDEDDFEVDVMTVTDGMDAGDIYAAVIKVVDYYDGDDTVDKVRALVDGEEVTYLAEDGVDLDATVDTIVILEFDGDRVESYETTTSTAIEVASIDSIRVRAEGGDLYTMDDDVVVVVIDEGDFIAGELSDVLEGDFVDLIQNDDGDVVVIVLDLDAQ